MATIGHIDCSGLPYPVCGLYRIDSRTYQTKMGDFDIQEVEKMAEQTMLGIRHEITITYKVMTSLSHF